LLLQAALAIYGFAICGFDYSHLILKWNLTPCLCSKSGLAICSFAIHIQIFL
jgi:hypothetical protein